MTMTANDLIRVFQQMYRERWPYEWGAARKGCVDCSGAFVYAYQQLGGGGIYHGSNAIARKYVVKLLPISEAKPGMAAFKLRKPGATWYALPAKYQPGGAAYNGDVNDYYHIGLVDEDGKHVLNAQSVKAGFTRTPVSKWACVAELKAVSYEVGGRKEEVGGGESPTSGNEGKTMEKMYVTAKNGKTVRMRKAPSTSAPVIRDIEIGTAVQAGADIDGWREIICGDDGGYMMSQYLTADPPGVTYRVVIDGVTWEKYRKIMEICPLAEAYKE